MSARFSMCVATVAAVCAATVLGACGSSSGLGGSTGSAGSSGSSGNSGGMSMGTTGSSSGGSMQMGAPTSSATRQFAAHSLGATDWQEMKIQAASAPAGALDLAEGGSQDSVLAPPKHATFQLQVLLTDARTGVTIPYASVADTITSAAGKVVSSGHLEPVLSSTLGSYYANNVAVPAGRYELKLTVQPPVAARHLEYSRVWMHPHSVTFHFTWPSAR